MTHQRARALAYRTLTSAPLNALTLRGLTLAWGAFGDMLPREWVDGIDRFFARDLIGNVSSGAAGAPDTFRLAFVNAWFDQRITGVTLSIDGRRVRASDLVLRSDERETPVSELTPFEFPPGGVVELLAPGRPLADGLHLLELGIYMELAPMVIPIVPILMRGGAGDLPVLADLFRSLPPWPPGKLAPGRAHVVPHIHYDVEWIQTREVFERVGEANLHELLRLMEADPEMTFATDQVPQLESFKRRDPAGFERLAALVRRGRIEPVNGMYCEPDTNLVSGESLVRQSVAWQRYSIENFGAASSCGWLIDSFGMSAQLPQILAQSGTSSLFFSRARPAGSRTSEFLWQGLDGTRIVAVWMPGMYNIGHPVRHRQEAALPKMLKNYLFLRARSAGADVFYPCGVDHGRPQKEYGDMARVWNSQVDDVRFSFSLPSRFVEAVSGADLPVVRGEFQRELWGTYGARIHLKQLNRSCEFALAQAGKMAAVAHARGAQPRRAEIERLWRELMDCQFHDQICGCSTDDVASGMTSRLQGVLGGARQICRTAAASLCGAAPGQGFTLLAFNPLAQPVESLIQFEVSPPPGWRGVSVEPVGGGSPLPVQLLETSLYGDGTIKWARALFAPRLQGCGYRLFRLLPSEGDGPESVIAARIEGGALENGMLRVEVDPRTGLLGKVRLADGTAFDLDGSNRLTLEKDLGDLYLSGAYGATWAHRRRVAGVEAVERGPLRSSFEVTGRIGHTDFVQRVSLAAGSGRIDCLARVDFRDRRHRMRLRFPTGLAGGRWVHEIPFGWLERPGHELPAQNFVDLSSAGRGVTLINNGIPGNKLRGGDMHLTVLRSADTAFQTKVGPGGFELGEHEFEYSLYPHAGDHVEASSALEAYKHNEPPQAFVFAGDVAPGVPAEFSLLSWEDPGVLLSSIDCAEGGGLCARLWEASGDQQRIELTAGVPLKGAGLADLLGNRSESLEVDAGAVRLTLRPFEIANVVLLPREP